MTAADDEAISLRTQIDTLQQGAEADVIIGPLWQYEISSGRWAAFSIDSRVKLTRALACGDQKCDVQHGAASFVVDLHLMQQMDRKSLAAHRVRCCLGVPAHWLSTEDRSPRAKFPPVLS